MFRQIRNVNKDISYKNKTLIFIIIIIIYHSLLYHFYVLIYAT